MYFNSNLVILLQEKKITASELARKLGLSRQIINNYKQETQPRYETLIKISEIYNISIDDLLKKDLSKK